MGKGPSQAPLPLHAQHDNKLAFIECQRTETHVVSLSPARHTEALPQGQ